MAERMIMIPVDCRSALWNNDGMESFYVTGLTHGNVMRFLNLLVEIELERRAGQSALLEDDCWEWG